MAKITPGNRVYLYQLLSRELGVNRQTLLPRAEEALVADGLAPADLGCADMRELCEQLPEFIKLTVFKKGYVYATVLSNEEYDRALERLADGADEKGAASGKPWKRRKGAKALKPIRPRHVEAPEPEPEPEPAPEPEPEPEPKVVEKALPEQAEAVEPAGTADAEKGAVAAEKSNEAAPVAEVEADEAETEPRAEAAAEPEPEVAPGQKVTPGQEVAPVAPSISLTITYTPEPADDAPAAETAEPMRAVPVSRPQSDLPQDFHADVRCSNDQLSTLYQVLPADVDPLATLEEDFRVARSTGALAGTRSNVTFSLRYLQTDGRTPVRVTLRRSACPVAGKRWALADVEAGEPAEVGLEGLSAAAQGPWSAFLATDDADAPDPERAFAQAVALGSWDETLEALAELAAPEEWGENRHVLREHLTMTFARVQATGALAVSEDGNSARFDTGLLDASGSALCAVLERSEIDIPWRLAGFSPAEGVAPVRYVTSLAQATLDPSLPAPDFPTRAAVTRNPRLATTVYDPVHDEVLLLVPDDGKALALRPTSSGYERVATLSLPDAYSCARVTGSEQPAWLRG